MIIGWLASNEAKALYFIARACRARGARDRVVDVACVDFGRKPRRVEMAHRVTSVRMGPVWWFWLRQVASEMRMPVIRLIADIDRARPPGRTLSATLRLTVARYFHDHRLVGEQ